MGSNRTSNSYPSFPVASLALRTAQNAAELQLLKRFRNYVHAWAGVLVFIGALSAAAAAYVAVVSHLYLPEQPGVDDQLTLGNLVIIVLATTGAVWIAIGALVCLKNLPVFYLALVLCYLSLLGNVFALNLIAPFFLGPAIFLGHRVISIAGQMQRAGVPLYLKPEQITM
jgi:hypothetical protein